MRYDKEVHEIKEAFESDEENGRLFWKINRMTKYIGDEAGGFSPRWNEFVVTYDRKMYRRADIIYAIKTGFWPREKLKRINKDRKDDRYNNLVQRPDFLFIGPKKISFNSRANTFSVYGIPDKEFTSFNEAKMKYLTTRASE